MKKHNVYWEETTVKEIIRKTLVYIANNPGNYKIDNSDVTIEPIYEFIKNDFNDWCMLAETIEKYQDYINEQTHASETVIAKWGDNSNTGKNADIDGIGLSIDIKKCNE